jgi:hypothetical protein
MKKNKTINAIVVDLAAQFLITLIHAVGVGMVKFSNQKQLRFKSHKIKPLSKNKSIRNLMR